jgi:hypothetical protein
VSEAEAGAERPRRARSLVAESVTIVFSILLAFAIDAAWDSRREREEELRFLAAIDAEIGRNLELIASARTFRTAKLAAGRELLELATKPADSVAAADVDARIATLTWWDVGRWQSSAVETLVSGGKLSVVESQGLRQQLAQLRRTMEQLVQVEQQDGGNCLGRFIPYLIREGSLAQITNANAALPPGALPDLSAADQSEAPYAKLPVALPMDHRALLGRSEFLGLVTQTFTDQDDVLLMLDRAEQRLREVQAAIRAELGDWARAAPGAKP